MALASLRQFALVCCRTTQHNTVPHWTAPLCVPVGPTPLPRTSIPGVDGFMEYYKTSELFASRWKDAGGSISFNFAEVGYHVQVTTAT